jgi:hypothetical protein
MMKVTESKAWDAAEWEYSALQADILAPFFRGPLSQDQIVSRLRNIARRCPQYYPAPAELGIRLLCRKRSRDAEQMIDVERSRRFIRHRPLPAISLITGGPAAAVELFHRKK